MGGILMWLLRVEFRCDFVRYAAGNVHANKRTRVQSSIISFVQASCMSALVIWGVRSLCCVVSLTRHASAGLVRRVKVGGTLIFVVSLAQAENG